MNQSSYTNSLVNPVQSWTNFAMLSAQMMMTSAQVIGQRTSGMMLAGASPTQRDQQELAMMSKEKTAAAVESAQAMAQGVFKLSQQLAVMAYRQMLAGVPLMMSLATSVTPQQSAHRQANLVRAGLANSAEATSRISNAVPRIARKAVRPIHSKVAANHKRLATR